MNKKLLNTGVQQFITNNLNTDIMSVLLKKSAFDGIEPKELAQQIASKKKCRLKLPTWFNTSGIYYPKTVNIEQASSETTAKYKAEIVSGKTLVDVTGGFGVDSYFFSQKMENVWYCEINSELSEISAHNFKILGAQQIKTKAVDGINFVLKAQQQFNWLYIDPSRRNENKGKVFLLSDCSPDVPGNLEHLLDKTDKILLKTSPLLDIAAGLKELNRVKEIHVVAINNEVKELLWVLNKSASKEVSIKTVNFRKDVKELFSFDLDEERKFTSEFNHPLKYLYEPNAAIMKAGGFKIIGLKYSLQKLQLHTHLYTSNELISFPGRRFEIIKDSAYSKKEMKSLKIEKANIAIRNFPDTVAEIRKKYKIRDGGDTYLFFITNVTGDFRVLQCKKL